MTPMAKRVILYGAGAAIVVAAVVFSETEWLRPLTHPRTAAQRRSDAHRAVAKDQADLAILLIGNSHVQAGDPGQRLVECFARSASNTSVYLDACAIGNGYMENHLRSDRTLAAIDEGGWDVVVLQGQKYSTSGRYSYPIDACVEIGQRIANVGARIILFPEWGQVGNPDEARHVQSIHEQIAPLIPATIAPVGLAWDIAIARDTSLPLHASDGNHSSDLGGYLTGLVLFATISDQDPRGLPAPDGLEVDRVTIDLLQSAAWEAVHPSGGE
jgi:hypothetical protein